jgi:hypothetical protein
LGVAAFDLAQVEPGSQALPDSKKVESWLMTKSCGSEERCRFADEVSTGSKGDWNLSRVPASASVAGLG